MRASTMVHVYNRKADEWVVFVSGRFSERRIEAEYERAVHRARALAVQAGVPLRVHDASGRAIDSDG